MLFTCNDEINNLLIINNNVVWETENANDIHFNHFEPSVAVWI